MKASKDAVRAARLLLRASLKESGGIDESKAMSLVKRIKEAKPRNAAGILDVFARLVRLELEKGRAVVESAVEVDQATADSVEEELSSKYGRKIEAEFVVNPEILGGMRVRVGSDVWDASVRSRLDTLRTRYSS